DAAAIAVADLLQVLNGEAGQGIFQSQVYRRVLGLSWYLTSPTADWRSALGPATYALMCSDILAEQLRGFGILPLPGPKGSGVGDLRSKNVQALSHEGGKSRPSFS